MFSGYVSKLKAQLSKPIKLCFIATLLSTVGSTHVAFAEVYKVTKPNGDVVFTDRPDNNADNKIERLNIPNYGSIKSVQVSQTDWNNKSSEGMSNSSSPTQIDYQVQITEPRQARAYHQPAQTVSVVVETTPYLRVGDTLVILVDGKVFAKGNTAEIPTSQLSLGEHTLQVRVDYANGHQDIKQTRRFNVIRTANTVNHSSSKPLIGKENNSDSIRVMSAVGSNEVLGSARAIESINGFKSNSF